MGGRRLLLLNRLFVAVDFVSLRSIGLSPCFVVFVIWVMYVVSCAVVCDGSVEYDLFGVVFCCCQYTKRLLGAKNRISRVDWMITDMLVETWEMVCIDKGNQ